MSWNREQTEKLIRIYKNYPLLYKAIPQPYEKNKRDRAYLEIAYQMRGTRPGTTVEEIKNRIISLRKQYFNEQKKAVQGERKSEVNKLWCYDNLKYLDKEGEKELRLDRDSDSIKLKAEQYVEQNTEYDSIDTTEALYSEQYLDEQTDAEHDTSSYINQDDDMLSNVGYECVDEDLNTDFSNTVEAPYPAKRLRLNKKTSHNVNTSAKLDRFVESPVESIVETCDDGNLSESLVTKINETLDRANVLLSKISYRKESPNRPFIENLLLDLNRLPENALRRTKWKIADIVYKAYQEQQCNNAMLNS